MAKNTGTLRRSRTKLDGDYVDLVAERIVDAVLKGQKSHIGTYYDRENMTVGQLLEEMFGEESIDEYDAEVADAYDNEASQCEQYYYNIVKNIHDEKVYNFKIGLYAISSTGEFGFFTPHAADADKEEIAADNEYFGALIQAFANQDLALRCIVVMSNQFGSVLRIHLATDTPEEDYIFMDMLNGATLTLGRTPPHPDAVFVKRGDEVIFSRR